MLGIAGYQITEKVYEGARSVVYRACEDLGEDLGQKPIILKTFKHAYPSLSDIARFRRQYEIAQGLELRGVIKSYRLERHNNILCLILEDFGGYPIHHFIDEFSQDINHFLAVALKIAQCLGELHDHQIVHKDIKPANILFNPETEVVKLIDLGLSTSFSPERQEASNPNSFEGTLAYMSPEQTGRMNRIIDYRTDFYSLGATFYQVLVGHLPFEAKDPLELIHSHIARSPVPPHEINSRVPLCLSHIILKLMAKTAEDRYQSSKGLIADLTSCREQWQQSSEIVEFPLGQLDVSDRFAIPQKLYGRETEQEILLEAFEQVSQGTVELMLVSGVGGIGKSALIHEIHKPIVRQRGYFIAGKFDQLQRNIPYASLIQAFQNLVKQVLGDSQERIQQWRDKLLDALGPNGQVILEVLPEVELIIGSQPPLEPLPPIESQNRFKQVFLQFVGTFAQAEHPLVLFLDDLQWADLASISLLQELLISPSLNHLLVIGAYRHNEVPKDSALNTFINEVEAGRARVHRLMLSPLNLANVTQLVADTLDRSLASCHELAQLLLKKTDGNPFFLNRLLTYLYETQLIRFNGRNWQWHLPDIRKAGIPDDVVDLVLGELRRLPPETQHSLMLAAFFGNQFDLATLAVICQQPSVEVAKILEVAIAANLITPLVNTHRIISYLDQAEASEDLGVGVTYRFLHDRVQQAAYALLTDEAQRQTIHLQIGRLLLAKQRHTEPEKDTNLFNLVNQLNYGRDLIEDLDERLQLAQLNLSAGKKAKASVAYDTALIYLTQGMELLPGNAWEPHYPLTYALNKERLECEYLCGHFEQAQQLFQDLIERAESEIDAAEIYGLQIVLYTTLSKFAEVIQLGREGLARLGWKVPTTRRQIKWATWRQLFEIEHQLLGQNIPNLLDLSPLKDPLQSATLNLLAQVIPALYYTDMESSSLFYLKMANLSLRYGNSPVSAVAYLGLGRFLGEEFGQAQRRYQFGQLAIQLVEKFRSKALKCKTHFLFGGFIHPWTEPAAGDVEYLRAAYQAGIDSGDLIWACYANNVLSMRLFFLGHQLAELESESQRFLERAGQVGEQYTPTFLLVTRQVARCLQGKIASATSLDDEELGFEEAAHSALLKQVPGLEGPLNWYYVTKTLLYLLADDPKSAMIAARQAEKTIGAAMGLYRVADHCFYYALALAANDRYQTDLALRQDARQQLKVHWQQLDRWAKHSPTNFRHKADLIAAEIARMNGQVHQAEQHYHQAIQGSRQAGYVQNTAFASDLAANFYEGRGMVVISRAYRIEARYAYLQWGALTKVKALDEAYPFLGGTLEGALPNDDTLTISRSSFDSGSKQHRDLDLASAIKASQALSGEIVLEQLLARMVRILLENAGGQRVVLVLTNQGKPTVEAEGWSNRDDVQVLQAKPVEKATDLAQHVVNYVLRTHETVVLADATQEGPFIYDPYIVQQQPKSLLCAPLMTQGKLLGLVYLENNLATNTFNPGRLEAINILSTQVAISIENANLYSNLAALNQAYERFVPHEFLQFLERDSILDVQLGDQVLKRMTVLFADIRNFTSLSEQLSPKANFDFLNTYLKCVGPVIRQHSGFVDKYIGDAVMALFPNSADDAVVAAIALQKAVREYNLEQQRQGVAPIRIGVGIHTGNLMLGILGEEERMESTVISDSVNLADRIEGLTKIYGNYIAVTSETLGELSNSLRYQYRFLGQVQVRGKEILTQVFDFFDGDGEVQCKLKAATRTVFEQGIVLYHAQEFHEAKDAFQTVLAQNPEDGAAKFYLQRCQEAEGKDFP